MFFSADPREITLVSKLMRTGGKMIDPLLRAQGLEGPGEAPQTPQERRARRPRQALHEQER